MRYLVAHSETVSHFIFTTGRIHEIVGSLAKENKMTIGLKHGSCQTLLNISKTFSLWIWAGTYNEEPNGNLLNLNMGRYVEKGYYCPNLVYYRISLSLFGMTIVLILDKLLGGNDV